MPLTNHQTLPLFESIKQDRIDGPKPKRAARANLNSFTAEQKQERRKERARVYSAIARERQEAQMKELKLRVESLTVYKVSPRWTAGLGWWCLGRASRLAPVSPNSTQLHRNSSWSTSRPTWSA